MRKIFLALTAVSLLVGAEEVQNSTLIGKVDMSTYKKIEKQNDRIVFDTNNSATNGIYNFSYSPNEESTQKESNIFLDGFFDTIHRYEPLYFNGENLTKDSQKILQEIVKKIHQYTDTKSREIVVSIIGFTQKIENKNEEIGTDSSYINFFQNIAKRDDLDPKLAKEEASDFIGSIYRRLLDNNISKEILYTENRVGKDTLYTEEFSCGREKNNRVEVAIYVKKVIDLDSDGDGVKDSKDYCLKTPLGANVDKNGCPLILNLDLLFDFDKATISDEKSLQDIQNLASFMKKYPVYHADIVGHTDSKGSEEYNQKLSLRRAEYVKNLMIQDGVEESRLSYEGRGESEPLFENINPLNRHKNRRTEVELTIHSPVAQRAKIVPRKRGMEE